MRELTNEVKEQIREMVYNYLEEECETDRSQFDDNTNIIEDLDGDSLMFVELVELLRKQYDLSIQIQNIGKYLLKNPAQTVGEVIDICCLVYEKEDAIANEG